MYTLTEEEMTLMPARALSKNASGLIFDPFANRYLLHFRDHHTKYYPETWALFGGGSERRESPWQTLIRELKEELTLAVPRDALISKGKRAKSGGEYSHYFLVLIDASKHELVLQEGADMAWFTTNDLIALVESRNVTPGLLYLHDRNDLVVREGQLPSYQHIIRSYSR